MKSARWHLLELFLVAFIAMGTSSLVAQDGAYLTPGARIAVVGDSITEQKLYSKYMEAYLLACTGVPDLKVFQFGWGGETAGGFSARLENDLAVFRPTVVTLCYGMNDGGYQPFREAVGKSYESNMQNVLSKLKGLEVAKIVVGSPGAVDSDFFRPGQMLGEQPAHVAYNDNLAHLRDIDRKLAAAGGYKFADVHAAMFDAMGKAKAKLGNKYDVCGKDGFHPGPNGHLLMAYAFLKGLGADGKIAEITIDMGGTTTASDGHKVVSSKAGECELESSRWPFCHEGDATSSAGTRSILPFAAFDEDLNRFVLKVKNLTATSAKVTWGKASKSFPREKLDAGVNLAAEFEATPFDADFRKFTAAIGAKQQFETYMIKNMISGFRALPADIKADAELAAGLKTITSRLAAKQADLDGAVRKTLVPVKHTLSVTAE